MPSVDVAMARSLRGGVWGSIAESLGASLARRDAISDVQAKAGEAVNAFSSWDNCMQVTYCKWPVIAIIIVGGLILFSIVWCIIRCACCGLSCCCECCYCLKCCGQCCGMCDPPKGRAHRYLDNETLPPNQGYRAEPPMKAPMPSPVRPTAVAPPAAEPPQYAEFAVERKGGEDALPAMPSWENANSKKVAVEELVEMDQLKKPAASAVPAAAAMAVSANHASPAVSPGRISPYGQPSPVGMNGYAPQGTRADPYAGRQDQAYNYNNAGYGGPSSSSLAADQHGAAGVAMGPGRHSPHQDYNGYNQSQSHADHGYGYNQADQGYGSRSHSPQAYGGGYAHNPQPQTQGYGRRPSPPRQNTYGSEQQYMRHSPAPQADYGYEQQQQYPQDSGYSQRQQYPQERSYNRPYPPQPQRQYTGESRRHVPQPSPSPERQYTAHSAAPIHNNSGFDFNSGYSRPQQLNNYGRRPSAPQQQPSENPGYSAYRPYQGGGY